MTDRADTAVVRTAHDEDWPAIWPIVRSVAAAGDTFTFPRDLDEEWGKRLWRSAAPGAVLVAVDPDGTVVGSAKVGANQLGPGSHVATASFVVATAARGRGVGRLLGEAALEWARAAGFAAMQFNAVVGTNAPAVALWKSLGFAVVGTVPEAFALPSREHVPLLIMHRMLR